MPNAERTNLKEKLRRVPHTPGVYLMKDRLGSVLYVGKAKDLKKRVSQYFTPSRQLRIAQPKVAAMLPLIFDLDWLEVKSEPEALLLEGRLIKQYKPRYNTDFTDDKRFLLVRLEADTPLPRFRLTRLKRDERCQYFGPFAQAGLLRQTLAQMRKKFGILLGDAKPLALGDGRWRLYDDARGEIYGHPNEVTEAEYAARLALATEFLEGKSRQWLEDLRTEMQKAAAAQQFEKAAELRDLVFALERTVERKRTFVRASATGTNPAPVDGTALLGTVLGLAQPPRRLECFDISHISGTFAVASLVAFAEGKPDKANYRRFRIRSFSGNDDFRAMEEVVGRRYRRLHEEGKAFPDLVVIDGGGGQVGAALKAFVAQHLEPPPLIGLAKREETIIFSDGRPPLKLPHHHEGLRLLQRLRDEAHRFANTYNAEWRSRKIRETILFDIEGLGDVRREALLAHFKTIERLRAATAEELQEVEGVGPKLAETIVRFFASRPARSTKATATTAAGLPAAAIGADEEMSDAVADATDLAASNHGEADRDAGADADADDDAGEELGLAEEDSEPTDPPKETAATARPQ